LRRAAEDAQRRAREEEMKKEADARRRQEEMLRQQEETRRSIEDAAKQNQQQQEAKKDRLKKKRVNNVRPLNANNAPPNKKCARWKRPIVVKRKRPFAKWIKNGETVNEESNSGKNTMSISRAVPNAPLNVLPSRYPSLNPRYRGGG